MAWHFSRKDGRSSYIRDDGARVESCSGPRPWRAYAADGSPIRVPTNDDGSPYTPRPWHGPRDLPQVRFFPTAVAARRFLDRD
jgi:hypothetical protein